ncbi:MAG: hypothetical protein NT013_24810 [Planctomycetia bacterium]|nr:hypothetical protein [Planctomycetia bacterium]
MSKRRMFTREVEAISLVTRQGLSLAEAARRLEIGEAAAEVAGAVGDGRLEGDCLEVSAVGVGRGEPSLAGRERSAADGTRDLKKATVFFAKESR